MKRILALPLLLLVALLSCEKNDKKPEYSLSLSEASIDLFADETHPLTATLTPPGSSLTLTWSSSNESVVKVDQKGVVTALKTGKATVLVSTSDKLHKAACDVMVNPSVYAALNTYKYKSPNAHFLKNGKIEQSNIGRVTDNDNEGISLVLSGKDVYMCLARIIGERWMGSLYKNGKLMYDLSSDRYSHMTPKSMVMHDGHLYTAGDGLTPSFSLQGVVWKDSVVLHEMVIQLGYPVFANSVFVAGNDVYVAGGEKRNRDYRSIVWKNGDILYDYADSETKDNDLYSVFVHNGVVYAGGHKAIGDDIIGVIFKNNELLYKLSGNSSEGANDGVKVRKISSDGTILYAVGVLDNQAAMWKNGVPTLLGEQGDSDRKSIAEDIFLYGADVYIAGMNKGLATIWKNGKQIYQHTLGEGMTSSKIASLAIQ